MNYLLDSNIVSDFYNADAPAHEAILQRFDRLSEMDQVYVSVLTLYELSYGLANAPEEKRVLIQRQMDQLTEDFELLPLFAEAAQVFGPLKRSLQTQRGLNAKQMQRHNIDLMLAVTALTKGAILVSADGGFAALQGLHPRLMIEDWTLPLSHGKAS